MKALSKTFVGNNVNKTKLMKISVLLQHHRKPLTLLPHIKTVMKAAATACCTVVLQMCSSKNIFTRQMNNIILFSGPGQ